MLKLTRLNNQTVAINPDHISWIEATPDTSGSRAMICATSLCKRDISLNEILHSIIAIV